jgi:hypothetical protein
MSARKAYRRDWLNKKEGRALIITNAGAFLAKDSWHKGEDYPSRIEYVDASLEIGDCSRSVVLEFEASTREAVDEKLDKLNLIKQHIEIIEALLTESRDELPTRKQIDAWNKKRREEKKQVRTSSALAHL